MSVVLNEDNLADVIIENTNNFNLALKLLKRDETLQVRTIHLVREFLRLLSINKLREAASLITVKNSRLRRLEILNKFLEFNADVAPFPPVYFYFNEVLQSYPYLFHFEALALIQGIIYLNN